MAKILTTTGWVELDTPTGGTWIPAFRNMVANDNVNKHWTGVENITGIADSASLLKTLKQNKFNQKLQRLGYQLSQNGAGYGLFAVKMEKRTYIGFSELFDVKEKMDDVVEAKILTGEMVEYNGGKYDAIYKCEIVNTGVRTQKVIIVNNTEIEIGTEYVIKGLTRLPIVPIYNNALKKGDIPKELDEHLGDLDVLVGDILNEWYYTRTQYVNNKNYNTGTNKTAWNSNIKNGRVHDINAPEGVIASSLAPLISNSSNMEILQKQIAYVEDRILKYSMQYRDGSISGTNKTISEIMSQNQQAFEYMLNKFNFITEQLEYFISIVAEMEGHTDWENLTLELKQSELEKYKIEKMRSEIETMDADANVKNAQADATLTQPADQTEVQ